MNKKSCCSNNLKSTQITWLLYWHHQLQLESNFSKNAKCYLLPGFSLVSTNNSRFKKILNLEKKIHLRFLKFALEITPNARNICPKLYINIQFDRIYELKRMIDLQMAMKFQELASYWPTTIMKKQFCHTKYNQCR